MASARFNPTSAHWLRGGRKPHGRAVGGRWIASTKVRALPEWLGQCKLLETLCVPPAAAAAVRVSGGAGAARGAAAPGRWCRSARRWMRRRSLKIL